MELYTHEQYVRSMADESGDETNIDPADSLFGGGDEAISNDKPTDDSNDYWYPTVEEIIDVHDAIIAEDPDGQPGIEDRDRIQFAIDYVKYGSMGERPETVHEKAFTLLRLIASNHWFVDGNKRTALNTTNLFYLFNGYDLDYGEDLRAMLKLLAVRETIIDRQAAIHYFADHTSPVDLGTLTELLGRLAIARWIDDDSQQEINGIGPDDHNR